MIQKRYIFIGGAWPYANYFLHVGHLAALLPGDILAKYFRGNGDNVIYVSGSDCHGTPITERAKKEGVSPQKIATYYHQEFKKTFDNLGFEYDLYSNTMDDFHQSYVQDNFKKLIENGYIYAKEVPQDYCETCETFLSDREIVGTCPICGGKSTGDQCEVCNASLDSSEVLDKHCKTCGTNCVTKNNNYLYFALSKFTSVLQELINKNGEHWRKNAVGEAQKFLNLGLIDRAATRQLNWGVEVPVEGYDDKRIYVWIEAVLGYLSAGTQVANEKNINFDEFLSDSNEKLITYYVHGKDNIPFHTTIFPALLTGLNKGYRLPDYIISSAYVNLNNEKMSKSKGNLITANELLEYFDKDTIRFYFAFNGPEVDDINCSYEEIVQCHNKFLVGMLGNFVNRNLSFICKKFEGKITEGIIDSNIVNTTSKIYKLVGSHIEAGEFRKAVISILDYISLGNKYYDSQQPWNQVKNDINAFNNTTYTCVYMMANIANLIAPILPDASKKIKDMLDLSEFKWEEEKISGDMQVNNLSLLYERIDDKNNSEVSHVKHK